MKALLVMTCVMVGCAASPGDGSDGSNGSNGQNGSDGTSGQDGANGVNGKDGVPGADGAAGPAGPPGASAVQSGSRLKAISWVADDGAKAQLPYVWFDADMGTRCSFAMAADGQDRCLPTSSGLIPVYTDAACSSLAFVQFLKDCPVNGFALVATGSGCALNPMSEVHKAGTLLDPAAPYFQKSGNQCSPWNIGPTFLYYADDGVIAPTEFVAATSTVDP